MTKHSSLFGTFVSYEKIKCCEYGPWPFLNFIFINVGSIIDQPIVNEGTSKELMPMACKEQIRKQILKNINSKKSHTFNIMIIITVYL